MSLGLRSFGAFLVCIGVSVSSGLAQDQAPVAPPEFNVPDDVLSDGSFQYRVPFEVPAFRGLEPNLGLTYSSSHKGFGKPSATTGAGWNLSAGSSIERVSMGGGTPTFADGDDIFRLDGMDLLLCADAEATAPLALA